MIGGRRPSQHRSGEDTFRLVFVCTGNICRSPTAEILTRHLLKGRLGGHAASRFVVSSAGVQAVTGSGIHPLAREQLARWRLDGEHSDRFVARQLTHGVVGNADLVLGASPRHRSSVLEQFPELLDRTFALREFARLAAAVPAATLPPDRVTRARAVVVEARAQRGRSPFAADDRIPDPMGGPPEAHQQSTGLIFETLTTILDVLAPWRAPSSAPWPRTSRPPTLDPDPADLGPRG